MRVVKFIRRLLRDNRAATAIEYGLVLALVCLAIMVSLRGVGDATSGMWSYITTTVVEALSA